MTTMMLLIYVELGAAWDLGEVLTLRWHLFSTSELLLYKHGLVTGVARQSQAQQASRSYCISAEA